MVNLDVESEPLDKVESTDDIENQVVLDSDDEGPDRTDAARTAGPTLGYVGYLRKRSNSVGVKSFGADRSTISTSSDKESHCDPKSGHTVAQYKKPRAEEQMKGKIVKKFDRDCDSKNSGSITIVSSNTEKDHVAQTNYNESQEPEDPSNALDFVDHYLSVIYLNLPPEIETRKANSIKSPPSLCAKGTQRLAWRANLRTSIQASSSFDWNENQTDDGGGFIFRNLQEKNTKSSSTDSRFMVQNSSEMIQDSILTRNYTNFVAELDKQFDASSSGQQQEYDGTGFDTEIFDTQMAAEVMKELLYAPPPNENATAYQGLENILEDIPKDTMPSKPFSSLDEKPGPRFTSKRSNRTKRRSKKLSSSTEALPANQNLLNPNRTKADKNISTSKSVCKKKLTGSYSPIACRTRRGKNTSIPNVMEVNTIKRRRSLNLNSKLNQNEGIEPVVAGSSNSSSDMWTCYPKRKRTRSSYKKSEKADTVNSVLCYDAPENVKLDVLPPVHKKKASKSPLCKELNRLGLTDDRLPDFTPKDLRRRRTTANVRVLFSQSLDVDTMKQQKKILARMGLSIASCCSAATHFITDKYVRTSNMLEAIAAGKPVVTHFWLDSCAQANCLVDEKMYILRDEKKEKEIGFSMPLSLARSKESPLLKGRRVFVSPNVKPNKEIIESLVKAVHGQALDYIERDAAKSNRLPNDLLIISCEEDYLICEPFLKEGAAIYSSELLLSGIVTHRLDYKRHALFIDCNRRNCNITYSRKNKVSPPVPCN